MLWFLVASLLAIKYGVWFELDMLWEKGKRGTTEGDFMSSMTAVRQRNGIALFGILMVGKSDREVGGVITDPAYRADIADNSGKDCWFIYFRQGSSDHPSNLDLHNQHADGVSKVAEWLNLKTAQFPCFVFFTRPEEAKFIYVPLSGLSKEGVVKKVRQIFDFVREKKTQPNFSPFEAIQQFQGVADVRNAAGKIGHQLYEVAIDLGAEIISKKLP